MKNKRQELSCYKRKNSRNIKFSVVITYVFWKYYHWECVDMGVYIYILKLQNLGICFLFKITGLLEKHYKQPHIQNTKTLINNKNFKLLKMFSSPFQQQQPLCWSPLLFAFIALSSIMAEGIEYSRTSLIYLTNSHTS